jgi:ubiquinone/menaquinone biosynthesis C-methylase UbiE
VNPRDAVELIRAAMPRPAGTWADLGAGDGTFTRALVELLGPESRIYAVDRDARALAALERWAKAAAPNVIAVRADFTRSFEMQGLADAAFDGMLFANALHYVRDAGAVLARLAQRLRPGGRVVIVEYDRRPASRWVPHPIPAERLPALAAAAGLSSPVVTGRRRSAFGGNLYVAAADRPGQERWRSDPA